MEDIVEEIVGEIADEHDEDLAPSVIRQADGSFLANGRASLNDITAIIGPEFDVGQIANDVETLAGYIASRIGRVPVRGELVPGPGRFEIEVLDADPRRVKRLKISQNTDRLNGRGRDKSRLIDVADTSSILSSEFSGSSDASTKLASDAPPKAARRP